MKTDFLKGLGLEQDAIDKIMAENGKDIAKVKADVEELKKQLTDKDASIEELNKTIKEYEGTDDTIKTLQKKVADYEQAEKDRVQAEKDAEADRILTENILGVIGDKEFVNDYTKNSIVAQVKTELAKSENKGKGAGEIFETLTKDVEGIFKNPQQQKLTIPPAGGGDNNEKKVEFRNFF